MGTRYPAPRCESSCLPVCLVTGHRSRVRVWSGITNRCSSASTGRSGGHPITYQSGGEGSFLDQEEHNPSDLRKCSPCHALTGSRTGSALEARP